MNMILNRQGAKVAKKDKDYSHSKIETWRSWRLGGLILFYY
jgi:hypothetical protein